MEVKCKNCDWSGNEDLIDSIKNKVHGGYDNACPNCESTELDWEEGKSNK